MINLDDVRTFYEENIYGRWRNGEKVLYRVNKISKRPAPDASENPFAAMFRLSTDDEGIDVEIMVEKDGKRVDFTVRVYLPEIENEGEVENKGENQTAGFPFIVCMHPILKGPKEYALKHGYALIFMDTAMIAEDNNLRKGCFYDLYPYGNDPASQTGELMAWGWGASKVIDAIYSGLGMELGIEATESTITGVSRWGKATAVCGAFEKRFKNVVPVCSGAGGLALWGVNSEGKTFDMTRCGGPKEYTYGKNEPLDCLQSEAERGWFVDKFLEYKEYADIPIEQYYLPVLAAGEERYYYIVAAWMGEDWVNAPAMWECYEKARLLYEELGLENHIYAHFHREGHAILVEDLEFFCGAGV